MTEEQDLLSATTRDILTVPNTSDSQVDAMWPSTTWTALDRAGLTSVGFADPRGGSGGTLGDVATLVFEVGRSHSKVPLPETVMFSSWLSAEANWAWSGGAETVCIADGDELEIRRIGERLYLNGSVASVPWARAAERVTLVANVDGDTTLIALKPEEFKVQFGENLAGEPRDTLILESILGPQRCHRSEMDIELVRLRGALMRAVASVGAMCAIFELTSKFVNQREQFGRPIEKFQAVQHLLARLGEEVSASTSCVSAAVGAVERGTGTFEAMCAIVKASQSATLISRIAHQVHGAIGTTTEYPLHLFTRRLWCWKSEYGSEAMWGRAISNHVRNQSDDASLWSVLTDNG